MAGSFRACSVRCVGLSRADGIWLIGRLGDPPGSGGGIGVNCHFNISTDHDMSIQVFLVGGVLRSVAGMPATPRCEAVRDVGCHGHRLPTVRDHRISSSAGTQYEICRAHIEATLGRSFVFSSSQTHFFDSSP